MVAPGQQHPTTGRERARATSQRDHRASVPCDTIGAEARLWGRVPTGSDELTASAAGADRCDPLERRDPPLLQAVGKHAQHQAGRARGGGRAPYRRPRCCGQCRSGPVHRDEATAVRRASGHRDQRRVGGCQLRRRQLGPGAPRHAPTLQRLRNDESHSIGAADAVRWRRLFDAPAREARG